MVKKYICYKCGSETTNKLNFYKDSNNKKYYYHSDCILSKYITSEKNNITNNKYVKNIICYI